MAIELSYQFPGDQERQFGARSVRLGAFMREPFTGMNAALAKWFETGTRKLWASEGVSEKNSTGWPAWAKSTAKRKKSGDKLMIVTGKLKGALTSSSHPAAVRDVKPTRAELGVDLAAFAAPYPAYHQAGSPDTNLPIRKVVDMGKGDSIALAKLVQSALVKRARAAGYIDGSRDLGVSRAF